MTTDEGIDLLMMTDERINMMIDDKINMTTDDEIDHPVETEEIAHLVKKKEDLVIGQDLLRIRKRRRKSLRLVRR